MENPPAEKLLKKIQQLEESQEDLKREMSKLQVSSAEIKRRSHSASPQRPLRRRNSGDVWRKSGSASFRHASPVRRKTRRDNHSKAGGKFSDKQYLNILQSMAQAVHVTDLNGQIIFWNSMAEKLYGFSAVEALGKSPIDILVDSQDAAVAENITRRCSSGESLTGEFPVKNKAGERFSAVTTISPFYDDDDGDGGGSLIGILCMTNDSALFQDPRVLPPDTVKCQEEETSLSQGTTNSVIPDLASNQRESHQSDQGFFVAAFSEQREEAATSGASTPRGDFIQSPFGVCLRNDEKFPSKLFRESGDGNDGDSVIAKTLTSEAEECNVKKGVLTWPLRGNERDCLERRHEQEKEEAHQSNKPADNDSTGSSSSSNNVNSTSSVNSCESSSSSVMSKADRDSDYLDNEILWEDMTIGAQIGQGSCGTVYRCLWFGSDVAVKVFSKQEYPEEVVTSFKQEVSFMKKLRHPNVLLFMGAVASPQHLCIVTEFLPRGSLFRLLQRNTSKLDWRRRIQMALDIARGMNYLHHCSPPIIHRDLKSSNLLVDRNWTVKVADFGLSCIKHDTYLTTKTPQWMAPEVLRNEAADEKSDVYSFGVIVWELLTEKIPWESLNAVQVIEAVGFMNQRLKLPKDVDPLWISIMESCWHREPQHRPTFQELMEKLRELQRKYATQFQEARAASIDNSSVKEEE
ncbi:unnamed protein product [Microthlaspi erraticum]|uniref:non-specific serine/threonine protein kinase n=1 Tax=Microthlaspi erraticum TaxID=1685480 RepID=A0A6D2L1F4_9BRAS|nr:unnamed protein product [Microthlaspi erraticum]